MSCLEVVNRPTSSGSTDSPSSGSVRRVRSGIGRTELALALVVTGFALATAVWIHLDTVPPIWDAAQYLYESERLYHTLVDQGPVAFVSAFSRVMGKKAPLITVLPLPFYALFGESHLSARYVNLVFIVLASWYLFRLGEIAVGRRAALLGVVFLNTMPLVVGMSRYFFVEYGLMTLVIAWMYYLVRWQGGEERGASWALGLVLGLGMLMKVTFPLYVAAPTALVFGRQFFRKGGGAKTLFLSVARIAVVAVPIAGLWYLRNWRSIFAYLLRAGYGEVAQKYSMGDVFSPATVGAYSLDVVNFAIGAPYFLLLLVVACWVAPGLRRTESRSRMDRDKLEMLLAWWLVPWLVTSLAVTKSIRYTVPYLPALALLLGAGCVALARRRLAVVAAVLLLAMGLTNYGLVSFGPRKLRLRAGSLVLVSGRLGWSAHPPVAELWPNESVVRTIAADAEGQKLTRARVSVLFKHPRLSADNLKYLAALHRLPVRFSSWSFQKAKTPAEFAAQVRAEADYLLTKTGKLGGERRNAENIETLELLREGGFPFDRIASIPLPDHTEVLVYRRNRAASRPAV